MVEQTDGIRKVGGSSPPFPTSPKGYYARKGACFVNYILFTLYIMGAAQASLMVRAAEHRQSKPSKIRHDDRVPWFTTGFE